jgi:hypothetical protein
MRTHPFPFPFPAALCCHIATCHDLTSLPYPPLASQTAFKLIGDGKRSYEFQSDSIEDKIRWMDTLNEEIARLAGGVWQVAGKPVCYTRPSPLLSFFPCSPACTAHM